MHAMLLGLFLSAITAMASAKQSWGFVYSLVPVICNIVGPITMYSIPTMLHINLPKFPIKNLSQHPTESVDDDDHTNNNITIPLRHPFDDLKAT